MIGFGVMNSKHSISYIVLFVILLNTCLLYSCRRNPGGIVEDPNNFSLSILCFDQSWEYGKWEPLKLDSNESIRSWDAMDAGNGGYLSVCKNCNSDRILDFDAKKQRVLLSSEPNSKVCDHDWVAGAGRSSSDLIEAGDIVIVQQRNYLFVFEIQRILGSFLDDQQVEYRVARFSLRNKCPVKIDLSGVKWKERKDHKAFPIAGRGIEFDLFPTMWTNDKAKFLKIFYDQYYGGLYGPEAVTGDDVAKIAIIHKGDIKEDRIVDFRRYRFKSWEDGLSNKCEKSF